MKAKERWVKYFDCVVRASVRSTVKGSLTMARVPPTSLRVILGELQALIAKDHVVEIGGAGDKPYLWLTRVHLPADGDKALILLTRSDRSAADLAIHDSATGQITVAAKTPTQGNAYSAHIGISLSSLAGDRYLMVVEDAIGIGGAAISRLLSKGIREATKLGSKAFLYRHPDNTFNRDGTPKTLKGSYKIEVMGHPSLDFEYELNNGELKDIEVVDATVTGQNYDGYNATSFRSKTIRLKPLNTLSVKAHDVIKGVCKRAVQQQMDQVRIKFADTEGVDHTVVLDPRSAGMLNEDRFIKRELIDGFVNRLSTATAEINVEIRDRILAKL